MMQANGRALLFDIDGTLADTDALHRQAFNQIFGPRGHVFDHARFSKELQGFSNASIGERFLPDESEHARAAILGQKEQVFRDMVAGQIRPVPGLMALLDEAPAAQIVPVSAPSRSRLGMLAWGVAALGILAAGVLAFVHFREVPLAGGAVPCGREQPRGDRVDAGAAAAAGGRDRRCGIRSRIGSAEL